MTAIGARCGSHSFEYQADKRVTSFSRASTFPFHSNSRVGPYTLKNSVVMAPLTRCRSAEGYVPNEENAKHYAARASAGLIITEATIVSEAGRGYPGTPAIYSSAQVEGWRKVVDAVHAKNGVIFLQLWHCGRQSDIPVCASPIPLKEGGPVPKELTVEEIHSLVQDFKKGAENALAAGFDGVEIHNANGYILDSFIRDVTNKRTDDFGGSIENRCRFPLMVAKEVIDVWGPERVGVRISPCSKFLSMGCSDPEVVFSHFVKELNKLKIGYLHVVSPIQDNPTPTDVEKTLSSDFFKGIFHNPVLSAGGYTLQTGEDDLNSGKADAIVYGKSYIANPDLVPKIAKYGLDAKLTPWDASTFYLPREYGGYEKGYNDYPVEFE
jgi:N-ethylmaleimide reductase